MNAEGACLPFDPDLPSPVAKLPASSCDCHVHAFEDPARYPLAAARSYTPAPAPLATYQRLMATTGIDRAVLVHPSVYGRDHRLFVERLQAHPGWLRGMAVVFPDTPAAEIEQWHQAHPGRLVWGSYGPHPAIAAPMVNDTALANAALDGLPDPALRQRVLVDNPSALYWS